MKVLKRGRAPGWTRRVKCDGCAARLEVSDADCKLVADWRDGDYFECRCPECRRSITIAASLVRRDDDDDDEESER